MSAAKIATGDTVRTIDSYPARLLGTVVEVFTAPGGETIAAVRVGPNPHEVQHFDTRTIEKAQA